MRPKSVAETAESQAVKAFTQSFDHLEQLLRINQGSKRGVPFYELVRNHRFPGHEAEKAFMKRCGDFRNFFSHDRHIADFEIAPPAAATKKLTRLCSEIAEGPRLSNRMIKEVETVTPDQVLDHVLALIELRDYSQFPVVDEEGRFKGLLTERGIAAWLAKERWRVVKELHFLEVPIRNVLKPSQERRFFAFAKPDIPLRSAILMFSTNPEIDALLITESGNGNTPIRGIFTLADMRDCVKEGF